MDWECAFTAPIWKAYEIPTFLKGNIRLQKPKEDEYNRPPLKPVSSGEEDDVFKEHMLGYENTSLKGVFNNEIDQLIPEWTSLYERSQRRVDFEFAVESCDNGFWCSRAHNWLDDALAG